MTTLAEAIRRTCREIAAAESSARRQLLSRYAGAYREIDAELRALTALIEAALARGEDVHPDWIRRQARWRNLLASIDAQLTRFGQESRVVVGNGQARAVEIGRNGAATQAQAAGYVVDLGERAPVVPAAQERLVSALATGSPLADTLAGYGPLVREVIEAELFTGIVEGRHPREVLRRIRGKVDGPMLHTRLEALVRTETMRALRGSLVDQYGRLGVDQVIWVSARSTRTCLACLALHGTVYPIDRAPTSQHINCRCVLSPSPRGVYAETEPFLQMGEIWFAEQPVSTQRAMLGSDAAYAAYRRGDVRISDFIGFHHDPRWGATVYQRSLRQAMEWGGGRREHAIRPHDRAR